MSEPEIDVVTSEPDGFERILRKALLHVDPPAGFSMRVLERAATPVRRASWLRIPSFRRWTWAFAVVALAMSGAFAWQVHLRRERARVQAQFEIALRITGQALDDARSQLARAGLTFDQ